MFVKGWYARPVLVIVFYGSGMLMAFGSQIDAWVAAIAGDDEAARVEARQLLPRAGSVAVPKLLPLLTHEKAEVWRTAYRVLTDIVNEVTAPGREMERRAVAEALMTLVAPAQPDRLKDIGLRLLPIALPEGADVSPIASLLRDPNYREAARTALELASTTPARAALREALANTDPGFQRSLLNSLAALRDEASLPVVTTYLGHANPGVRAAAARAVAWTGDPKYIPVLWSMLKSATGNADRREVADAVLRFADAMMESGGKWEIAMKMYISLLTSEDTVILNGALAGLGRYGDETVVPPFFEILREEKEDKFVLVVVRALRDVKGHAARLAMLNEYETVPPPRNRLLLSVFGETRDPLFADVLLKAWESDDAETRAAALEALNESELPQAVGPLIAAAKNATIEEKEICVDRLKGFAAKMTEQKRVAEAGRIYIALYQMAETDDERARALEYIYANPTPESFDILAAQLTREDLLKLPSASLFGMAKALLDAGRMEEGENLFKDAISLLTTTESVKQALAHLENVPDGGAWAKRFGFVTHWYVVGPFSWVPADGFSKVYVNEPNVDVTQTFTENESTLTWQPYEVTTPTGTVDLMALYGMLSNKTAFAFARIRVEQETDAIIGAGSDDGIRIWVNGQVVRENNVDRGAEIDQERVPIHLSAGDNHVLVQIIQGGGGWNFNLRLMRPDGAPLDFRVTTDTEKKES